MTVKHRTTTREHTIMSDFERETTAVERDLVEAVSATHARLEAAAAAYDESDSDPALLAAYVAAKEAARVAYVAAFPQSATVTPHPVDEAFKVRRNALYVLRHHGHSLKYFGIPIEDLSDDVADAEQLTRENCGACALGGFEDTTEDGVRQPNYGGWERIFVQAGITIPAKYREAFEAARVGTDNEQYTTALARDIRTFGVTFAD